MLMLMIVLAVFEYTHFLQQPFLTQCRATIYIILAISYNTMACRVFRLLRLSLPTTNETSRVTTIGSVLCFRPGMAAEGSLFTSVR